MKLSRRAPLFLSAWLALIATACSGELKFERIVIDDNFPGAYQVEVADVNGDGKLDIVAVGGGTCAWYENPRWTKRIVSGPKITPGVISSATQDIDGDGKAEIAIAYEFTMNDPTRGKLLLAHQKGDAWEYIPVADIGSIHRLRWGDLDADGAPDLVVAPIFGTKAKPPAFQEEPARIVAYRTMRKLDPTLWWRNDAGEARVIHAIDVPPVTRRFDRSAIYAASNLGVTLHNAQGLDAQLRIAGFLVARGAKGTPPKVGCSEIHLGKLRGNRHFIATVDPWHGTEVAVRFYEEPGTDNLMYENRRVIDSTLQDGHALWTADVDNDGDDEIFAGYRGPGTSVLAFDYNHETKSWDRRVVDARIAAQDLRGGDLDGDGTPDVVAVGGSTHNVIWYRPHR